MQCIDTDEDRKGKKDASVGEKRQYRKQKDDFRVRARLGLQRQIKQEDEEPYLIGYVAIPKWRVKRDYGEKDRPANELLHAITHDDAINRGEDRDGVKR